MSARFVLAALLALCVADAGAAILYKLVDPYGSITFSDTVPRGFQGEVTRMDIDTGTNLITPTPSGAPVARAPIAYDPVVRRPAITDEERLRTAAQRIEEARMALADAQNNSLAEDWVYLGPNNPLGMRRMPRPEYQARLDQLAANVVVAEAEYDALRRQLR
jgi:hypothetical protein